MKERGFIDPAQRMPELLARRRRKMARSAHAFVRGTTAKFYEWLETSPANVPAGPSVWICGDCHVGNLGPQADVRGNVRIQVRDLDQTVIGNPAHDIIRLGLSLASAARGVDLSGMVIARMLERLIGGYADALDPSDKDRDVGHLKPRLIEALLSEAMGRRWRHLAHERLEDVTPVIPLGRKFWPLAETEKASIAALIESPSARRVLTKLTNREDDVAINLVDAAYWVKGCSSLGRLRYAALLGFGAKNAAGYCLVDIKEAMGPSAPLDLTAAMPSDNAERVVTGARALSPNLGNRMFPAALLEKPVVVRELMPQDLKIEILGLSEKEALRLSDYLGQVLGHAHGRQLTPAARRRWRKELERNRPKTLDAPSWLWTSVVELVGVHEAAYLDHCRRIIAQAD